MCWHSLESSAKKFRKRVFVMLGDFAIKPILDKVVIKTLKDDQKTGGGIILAGGTKEQPFTAEVIARGPGGIIDGKKVEMYVNKGDKVLVPRHAGTPFTMGGKEYIIIRQEDILAIVS